MASQKPVAFLGGLKLLFRHASLVLWIYLVNLILAMIATGGFARRLGAVLDHSMIADRLVYGFDLGVLTSLRDSPELPLHGPVTGLLGPSIMFTIFMVFITGGLLVTYYDDRPLSTGSFFEACGHYFWRLVRLIIFFVIALIPVGILVAVVGRLHDRIDRQAVSPWTAVYFAGAALVVILLLMMTLRLWFDMAQIIAIAEDEAHMRKALRHAASLLRQNFASLFWLYLRISVVGWLGFGAAVRIWMDHVRPESIQTAIVLAQLSIIIWLATRLWQRASEARWYHEYVDARNADSRAPAGTSSPATTYTPAAL